MAFTMKSNLCTNSINLLHILPYFDAQNVHLVAQWLPSLDALLETTAVDSHPSYRVFITGEPAPCPEQHVIPRGILENAIKITNEPPTGMNASLHAALSNFSQVKWKICFISKMLRL